MSSTTTASTRRTRVLVIDDDPIILRIAEASLVGAGHLVRTATSAEDARPLLACVDVVVSDENLPGMGGRALLGSARASGIDTPFILMTGHPSVTGVVESYALGATSFLVKPLRTADLLRSVEAAARLAREAAARVPDPEDRPSAELRLHTAVDAALSSMRVVFQPICSLSARRVFGHEVLLRAGEPSLPHPGAVLEAAEAVGRLHEVGRRVRRLASEAIPSAPSDVLFFVNLHPFDLADPALYDAADPLVPFADRVVLEITERADFRLVGDVPEKLDRLRARGFRMAMDDLGTGYAGLASLVDLDPEVIKIDMGLVRDIDRDPRKRRLVGSLLRLCRELDRIVTAEGVERPEEVETLRELGCDLVQGYLLARPGPPFPEVRW